jgi:hypothetical protein
VTNQHPITPPPELVSDWCRQWARENDDGPTCVYDIATRAAQWGADKELEACVELTRDNDGYDAALGLRAARRPKPPSLKEEALKALDDISIASFEQDAANVIRRALEQLTD